MLSVFWCMKIPMRSIKRLQDKNHRDTDWLWHLGSEEVSLGLLTRLGNDKRTVSCRPGRCRPWLGHRGPGAPSFTFLIRRRG